MLISRYSNRDVEKRIIEMEENYGIALPEQYRKFLLEYNGGDTPDTSYKAGRASTVVRGFYGFGEVEHSFDKLDFFIGCLIVAQPFYHKQYIQLCRENQNQEDFSQ